MRRAAFRRYSAALLALVLGSTLTVAGCDDPGMGPLPDGPVTLPHRIGETELVLRTIEGSAFIPADAPDWTEALERLGVVASAIRLVTATTPPEVPVQLQAGLLIADGVDWAARLDGFVIELGADAAIAAARRMFGGRSVWRVARTDSDPIAYFHAAGETLVHVWTDDEDAAAELFASLSAGQEASAGAIDPPSYAARPVAADAAPAAAPAGTILISPIQLPLTPVCVAWPATSPNIGVTTMALGSGGPFPQPFMSVSLIAAYGTVNPPGSTGFHHYFLYGSTGYGAGSAETVQVHATSPTASGLLVLDLAVQHCLNGLWADGPRQLRIAQAFDRVTATIEEGELTCGATGQAFSGALRHEAPEAVLAGDDLLVCNPADCVEAGFLESTDQVDYDARVADDGQSITFTWDAEQFDREYDDEGELIACTPSGPLETSFPITRLTFGPDQPY